MKYIFLTLFLCTQHIVYAMYQPMIELQTIQSLLEKQAKNVAATTTADDNPDLITLNNAINARYDMTNNFFSLFIGSIPKADYYHNIINIFSECSITPNEKIITDLCTKNNLFKYAIEYFTDLARQNLDNVTIDTLETIQNSALSQPLETLNALPSFVKNYVMEKAYNGIDLSYDIILNHRNDTIMFFDICASAHHAAISTVNKKFHLYDLQTGKPIRTFKEDDYVHYINFNRDGSHIVTASNYDDNTSVIKIWATQSEQPINTKKLSMLIDTIRYTNDDMLIVCEEKTSMPTIITMAADTLKPITQAQLLYRVYPLHNLRINWENIYKTDNPHVKDFDSKLVIKKLDCRPFYLCLQAAKNIQQLPSGTMIEQPLFAKLTKHEKNIVLQKESTKITPFIKELNIQQATHTNRLLIDPYFPL